MRLERGVERRSGMWPERNRVAAHPTPPLTRGGQNIFFRGKSPFSVIARCKTSREAFCIRTFRTYSQKKLGTKKAS